MVVLTLVALLPAVARAQRGQIDSESRPARSMEISLPGNLYFDHDQFLKELKQLTIATARETLKINDEKIAAASIEPEWIDFDPPDKVQLNLTVVPASPELKALDEAAREKYLWRMMEQAAALAKRMIHRQRDAIVEEAARVAEISEMHSAEAREKVNHLRDQLRKVTGRADVTPSVLRAALTSLDMERQKLLLEADATNARRTAIETVLAMAAKKAAEAATGDPVLRELEELRAARAKEVEFLKQQFKSGIVGNQEVLRAQSAEVEARVRVLERKEQAARQVGGTALDDLNRQLLESSVRATEMQARLKSLQVALDTLVQSSSTAEKLEDAENSASNAARDAAQQRNLLQHAQMQAEKEKAEVIINGADKRWGGH